VHDAADVEVDEPQVPLDIAREEGVALGDARVERERVDRAINRGVKRLDALRRGEVELLAGAEDVKAMLFEDTRELTADAAGRAGDDGERRQGLNTTLKAPSSFFWNIS
jgi:hypothetical protein